MTTESIDKPGRGLLIAFEAGEGAGKSTQARLLHQRLRECGVASALTREPGGTPFSEKVRHLLVNAEEGIEFDGMSELMLLAAGRREHINQLIRPFTEGGGHVICDRFVGSTIAYQSYGRKVPIEQILDLHSSFCYDLWPDLTILIQIDPQEGLDRAMRRAATAGVPDQRFELERREFHDRVSAGYQQLPNISKGRVLVVDGTTPPGLQLDESIQLVHQRVVRALVDASPVLARQLGLADPVAEPAEEMAL